MEEIHKKLIDSDLRKNKNKYSLEELTKNVDNLSISTLLTWQILDANFCKKYILNSEYQSVEEQYKVDTDYVLKKQPHLKLEDLLD